MLTEKLDSFLGLDTSAQGLAFIECRQMLTVSISCQLLNSMVLSAETDRNISCNISNPKKRNMRIRSE